VQPHEIAEYEPKWVGAVELVVAVRRDDEDGKRPDSSPEQPEDIERRLVGPVQILEDEHRAPGLQLLAESCEHLVGEGSGGDKLLEAATGICGHVGEWPERAWREQRVTCAREDSGVRSSRAERADERGLADTRLAGDEDEPAAACMCLGQRLVQRFLGVTAFE
jgi:hypothetical protein